MHGTMSLKKKTTFFADQRFPIPNRDMLHAIIFMESLFSGLKFCFVAIYEYLKKIYRRHKILQVS